MTPVNLDHVQLTSRELASAFTHLETLMAESGPSVSVADTLRKEMAEDAATVARMEMNYDDSLPMGHIWKRTKIQLRKRIKATEVLLGVIDKLGDEKDNLWHKNPYPDANGVVP